MALDPNGEFDGVCACGKKEADGIRCRLGATHKPHKLPSMPWETQNVEAQEFPW